MAATRIGNGVNYWTFEQATNTYDISRGRPGSKALDTTKFKVRFAPDTSALLIIDMQNFFLSPSLDCVPLGRDLVPTLQDIIPLARKAGIRIVWVGWGISDHDLADIPPNVQFCLRHLELGTNVEGFGAKLDGTDNGGMLMKGSWSAQIVEPLAQERVEGDIWIDKIRITAFYGTRLESVLRSLGITTLFFAGVNTDQCVLSSFYDGACAGFDTVMLRDCVATSTTAESQAACLNNATIFGFESSAADLKRALLTTTTTA